MNISNNHQNIVVCFPSGAGGHLIGALCGMLLRYPEVFPDKIGSMHSAVSAGVVSGIIHVNASMSQDKIIQEKLPDSDIIVGHFTNVKLLTKINKKVIYITFTPDDLNEIVYRANKKAKNDFKDKNTYTLLAGTEWPTYEEFHSGIPILNEEENWSVNSQQYSYFVYNLPEHKNNTLEIKFSDINDSSTLIDDIANFMSVKTYDKNKLINILNLYRQANTRTTTL